MLTEVADGVWVRQSEWVWTNAIAVRGEGGLILVDPGIDGSDLNQLADDLDRLGIPIVAGFATGRGAHRSGARGAAGRAGRRPLGARGRGRFADRVGRTDVVAGTMIAPTCATAYAMVDAVAPAGTVTEAFAWMATAVAIGTSIGAAAGGAVADSAGPASAFVLAGTAAVVVAAVTAARSQTVGAPAISTPSMPAALPA